MKKIILIITLLLVCTALHAKKQWQEKQYIKYQGVDYIECIDSTFCLAFTTETDNTRILKSTDQGDTWEILYFHHHDIQVDSVYSINHCDLVNRNDVYMVYIDKAILEKSTDGGKIFERKTFGSLSAGNNPIMEFQMYNERIGLIVASDELIVTRDGWESYKIIPLTGDTILVGGAMFYVDSVNVAILKHRSKTDEFLLFNLDTEYWSKYNEGEKLGKDEPVKSIFDATMVNDTLGFACGGQFTGFGATRTNIIWKTTDKGKHWRIVNENEYIKIAFGLGAIRFKDDKNGMASAGYGIVLETTDGGENWEYQDNLGQGFYDSGTELAYAGQYPLMGFRPSGIYRYEEKTTVEEFEDANIKIYQSFDELKIELIDKPASNLQFQIVDLLGREILRKSYENQQNISVDLSQMNSGFYMYRIISDGRVLRTGKIVR
jgi:Secretion system C-terminal sorting domain